MPRLVKLSFGYCIYVLNLKPVKRNKSVPCHCKREKFYHVSCVSHGSFGRAAICSPSHYWAVLKIDILGLGGNTKAPTGLNYKVLINCV